MTKRRHMYTIDIVGTFLVTNITNTHTHTNTDNTTTSHRSFVPHPSGTTTGTRIAALVPTVTVTRVASKHSDPIVAAALALIGCLYRLFIGC